MTIKTETKDQSHKEGNDVKDFREKIKEINQNTESWVMKMMTNHMLKSEIKLENDAITVISKNKSNEKGKRSNLVKNDLEPKNKQEKTEISCKNDRCHCKTDKTT